MNTNSENIANAESRIRDVDRADEMVKYTRTNILQQVSQAMMAQAAKQPEYILQLLG